MHYMVEFDLPQPFTETFISLIPEQRLKIHQFMVMGHIIAYTLSMEHAKLWALINATDEVAVTQLLEKLPLTIFMDFQIHPLTFLLTTQANLPKIHLN
ncbi:MAG: hypothetical protein J0L94_03300 [Rhodothermia bacterium]|nr:hypothetical protein [Rhodothermia bacterium]